MAPSAEIGWESYHFIFFVLFPPTVALSYNPLYFPTQKILFRIPFAPSPWATPGPRVVPAPPPPP